MIRKTFLFFLLTISLSCGISRQRIEIPDFLIEPNGKGTVGIKVLNAYVFENNLKNIPFQQFITSKYKTNNFHETELWITIENQRFKLIFYNNDEFEKFFGSQNYTALVQENEAQKYGNQSKYVAISVINELNQDCLSENSLYLNLIKNYLSNLKNEYLNQ